MAVELAQVAAGLPVAASFALAGGITSFRQGRRRAALNEAMHELRRPLQILSLALSVGGHGSPQVETSLELATLALQRLDQEINGSGLGQVTTEVSVDGLIDEAAERWRGPAGDNGVDLKREWNGPPTYVQGDRFELSQALDNLLSNAIEHGAGEVRIGSRREGDQVAISVSNPGAMAVEGAGRWKRLRGGRSRRGHGLRVVARVAQRHGGSFALRVISNSTRATMRVPLSRRGGAG
jgi:signal transduction histidine kinase